MAAFVIVHVSSYGGLQKNILTLQSISLRTGCSSLSPQNEILLLFEGLKVCIFVFWVEESFATGFNENES